MKIIAHRGNLYGPDPETENTVEQAEKCFAMGFDVELDIWYSEAGKWFLGHDAPKNKVNWLWVDRNRGMLWLHAKNARAAQMLFNRFDVFSHQNDEFSLTASGDLWFYPGVKIKHPAVDYYNIVACLPELASDWDLTHATHICTDYPVKYAEKYKP